MKTVELKRQLNIIKSEIKSINKEIEELNKRRSKFQKEAKLVQEEIDKMNSQGIGVTERAVLRYFERVLGFNIEDIKKKITPETTIQQVKELGDGEYPIKDLYSIDNPFSIIVKNNNVITVLTEDINK